MAYTVLSRLIQEIINFVGVRKVGFLLLMGFAISSHAVVITFDGLAPTGAVSFTSSNQSGYVFAASPYAYFMGTAYSNADTRLNAYNGTDHIITRESILISRDDGGVFTFNSVDTSDWLNDATNTALVFTATFAGGGTLAETYYTDDILTDEQGPNEDFQHLTFSNFSNITSLTIDHSWWPWVAFDNFAFDEEATGVPEPTTLMLVGVGLAGLGFRAKKRKLN